MDLADEFRARAQRCLKLAQEAPTQGAQTHWLGMAQLWFNLAEYSEAQDAAFQDAAFVGDGEPPRLDESKHGPDFSDSKKSS